RRQEHLVRAPRPAHPAPPRGDAVPATQPIPHVDPRQRGRRREGAPHRQGQAARRRRRGAAPPGRPVGRGQGPPGRLAVPPLGWPAAAAVPSPLARRRTRGPAARRADVRPRPDLDGVGRGPAAQPGARPDPHRGDAQPRSGAACVAQHDVLLRGRARRARTARGPLRGARRPEALPLRHRTNGLTPASPPAESPTRFRMRPPAVLIFTPFFRLDNSSTRPRRRAPVTRRFPLARAATALIVALTIALAVASVASAKSKLPKSGVETPPGG